MEEPVQKKIRRETPTKCENDDTVQSCENLVDSNIYLTYDILRIVFRYLNGRDLASAAMVCRLWLEAANNEKCTRSPYCFIERYVPSKDDSLNCIKNSRVKPSVGFFFIPTKSQFRIKACILDLLPQNCDAIMLNTSGIVINNKELQYNAFPNMVCAFLPQIPNVKINMFKILNLCSELNPRTYEKYTYKYQQKELINMIDQIPDHDKSTCLMLFCNNLGYKVAKCLASTVQKRRDNRIASLWGGVVEEMYMNNTHDATFDKHPYHRIDSTYCLAILITGLIQSWSTVIDRECIAKEQIEERLRLFKDQVKLKKHSVGFMFACTARGFNMHQDRNVESTIFKTLFPKVPLVGCFGNGEFGKNTMPVEENIIGKKTKGTKWYNEYSTIFMILTYG